MLYVLLAQVQNRLAHKCNRVCSSTVYKSSFIPSASHNIGITESNKTHTIRHLLSVQPLCTVPGWGNEGCTIVPTHSITHTTYKSWISEIFTVLDVSLRTVSRSRVSQGKKKKENTHTFDIICLGVTENELWVCIRRYCTPSQSNSCISEKSYIPSRRNWTSSHINCTTFHDDCTSS